MIRKLELSGVGRCVRNVKTSAGPAMDEIHLPPRGFGFSPLVLKLLDSLPVHLPSLIPHHLTAGDNTQHLHPNRSSFCLVLKGSWALRKCSE